MLDFEAEAKQPLISQTELDIKPDHIKSISFHKIIPYFNQFLSQIKMEELFPFTIYGGLYTLTTSMINCDL